MEHSAEKRFRTSTGLPDVIYRIFRRVASVARQARRGTANDLRIFGFGAANSILPFELAPVASGSTPNRSMRFSYDLVNVVYL